MRVLILGPDHPGGSLPPYLDALAAALDDLAEGGAVAASLAGNAATRAHRFTADTHAARCLAVYQQVLDQGRRKTA